MDQPPPQPAVVQGMSLDVAPIVQQQAEEQGAQQAEEQGAQQAQQVEEQGVQQAQQAEQQGAQQDEQAAGTAGDGSSAGEGAAAATAAATGAATTAVAAEEWAEGGVDDSIWKEGVPSPYQAALQRCMELEPTLACLKEAAQQKRYRGQFLFPHFFIVGWQVGRGGRAGGDGRVGRWEAAPGDAMVGGAPSRLHPSRLPNKLSYPTNHPSTHPAAAIYPSCPAPPCPAEVRHHLPVPQSEGPPWHRHPRGKGKQAVAAHEESLVVTRTDQGMPLLPCRPPAPQCVCCVVSCLLPFHDSAGAGIL